MISLRNIAEQCRSVLGKGSIQELIQASINAYAVAAKASWYEGQKAGISEVNGSFIYTFKDQFLQFDDDTEMYFIEMPSSHLDLPHDQGVNQVSWMNSQDQPFVRLGVGALGLFAGLDSAGMGGLEVYTREGDRMYFPNVKKTDIGIGLDRKGILLKMAIALEEADVDMQLSIPPDVMQSIVTMVVEQYAPKEKGLTDRLT